MSSARNSRLLEGAFRALIFNLLNSSSQWMRKEYGHKNFRLQIKNVAKVWISRSGAPFMKRLCTLFEIRDCSISQLTLFEALSLPYATTAQLFTPRLITVDEGGTLNFAAVACIDSALVNKHWARNDYFVHISDVLKRRGPFSMGRVQLDRKYIGIAPAGVNINWIFRWDKIATFSFLPLLSLAFWIWGRFHTPWKPDLEHFIDQ